MKFRFKKTITICLLLFAGFPFQAFSGQIEGRAVDTTGRPIVDLHAILVKTSFVGDTDTTGHFTVRNIPSGEYTLRLGHIAYKTKEIEKIQLSTDENLNLNTVIMEPRIIYYKEMVVTATRTDHSLSELPQSINLVSETTIEEQQVKTSAEALREENGVSVQKTSHGGGSAILRGLGSNQILILVDGIRLNNSTYRLGNHQYLTTVDPFMLDHIEVVRGPTSVLYGTDALGGTIHLISKTPSFSNSTLSLQYRLLGRYASADNEKTSRVDVLFSSSKWNGSAGISYKNFGDLRRGKHNSHPQLENATNGILQTPSGFHAYDGDVKLSRSLAPDQSLTLAYQFSRQSHVPRYDKYENDGYFKWLYHPQIRDLAYFTYKNKIGKKGLKSLLATLSVHRQTEGREMQKSETSVLTSEKDQVWTAGTSLQLCSTIGKHALTYGMEGYFDFVESQRHYLDPQTGISEKDTLARYPDGARYDSFGIYVQDEMSLNRKWTVFTGLRYSLFQIRFDTKTDSLIGEINQKFQAITGSLGSVYQLNDNAAIHLNIAQGFRAPNLGDLSKFGESKGNIYEVPNPDLSPEKILSFDAGFKLYTDRWKASLTAYHSGITDILDSAPFVFLGASTIQINDQIYDIKAKKNIGNAYIRGLETSIFWQALNALSFNFQLTTTYGQNTTKNEPVGGIPPTFGLAGLAWNSHCCTLYFFTRFASKQNRLSADDLDDPRIPEGGTPGWHTLNLRFSWQFYRAYSLRLALENIEDINYREHGSGINAPGRNIIISLEMKK